MKRSEFKARKIERYALRIYFINEGINPEDIENYLKGGTFKAIVKQDIIEGKIPHYIELIKTGGKYAI